MKPRRGDAQAQVGPIDRQNCTRRGEPVKNRRLIVWYVTRKLRWSSSAREAPTSTALWNPART